MLSVDVRSQIDMKWKITSWICFVFGVVLIVLPIESITELINNYHLDVNQAEFAAKFYGHGFADKMEWSLVAAIFFLLAMLLMSRSKKNDA